MIMYPLWWTVKISSSSHMSKGGALWERLPDDVLSEVLGLIHPRVASQLTRNAYLFSRGMTLMVVSAPKRARRRADPTGRPSTGRSPGSTFGSLRHLGTSSSRRRWSIRRMTETWESTSATSAVSLGE